MSWSSSNYQAKLSGHQQSFLLIDLLLPLLSRENHSGVGYISIKRLS
uniref:Uncharacterized protein n=1 Tax=Arundo donax TaxID=35708 RepID=A0A0A9BDS3_ARUDO